MLLSEPAAHGERRRWIPRHGEHGRGAIFVISDARRLNLLRHSNKITNEPKNPVFQPDRASSTSFAKMEVDSDMH